jgi:hypothetical protein
LEKHLPDMEGGREVLPFNVAKSTWNAAAGHYLIVERARLRSGYGLAWSRYHWKGGPGGQREKISAAGTYNWKHLNE